MASASGFSILDLDLLERVLEAYNQRNLWASVGWFLERYRNAFFVPEAFLEKLGSKRPAKPRYLVRSQRGGALIDRWNLIVPESLLTWEGQQGR